MKSILIFLSMIASLAAVAANVKPVTFQGRESSLLVKSLERARVTAGTSPSDPTTMRFTLFSVNCMDRNCEYADPREANHPIRELSSDDSGYLRYLLRKYLSSDKVPRLDCITNSRGATCRFSGH